MRFQAILLEVCLLGLCASGARAQTMDPRETQARKDCMAGRWQSGADLLAELYAETGNPNYVYNQARCFEQNGHADQAILRFREYLRKAKNLSPEDKADVDQHIADCHAMENETSANRPVQTERAAEPAASLGPPVPAAAVAMAAPPASSRGGGLRVAGIVSASLGAAAVATGFIFGLQAHGIESEVTSDTNHNRYDRAKDDRGKLYAELQWVGYGVGTAAIAGGAILYYFGYRAQRSSDPSVALLPAVTPHHATVALRARF